MKKCPICGNELSGVDVDEYAPFCSERCRAVDLGRWFSDGYAIKGRELGEEFVDGGE